MTIDDNDGIVDFLGIKVFLNHYAYAQGSSSIEVYYRALLWHVLLKKFHGNHGYFLDKYKPMYLIKYLNNRFSQLWYDTRT